MFGGLSIPDLGIYSYVDVFVCDGKMCWWSGHSGSTCFYIFESSISLSLLMQFSRMRRCRYLFILTRTLMLSKTILCCDDSISCSTNYQYLHTALSYIFDAALDGASCPLNVTLTTLTRSCTYTPSKWSVGSLMVAVLQFFEPFLILSRFSFRESS